MVLIESLLNGFLLGAGASIPIGPINILIINEAFHSYKNAFFVGLGAMSADLTYLTLIFFGFFKNIKEYPLLFNIISCFGALFLIYLAYKIFKARLIEGSKLKTQQYFANPFSSYSKGYALTLLNPPTIAFWTSMLAYISQSKLHFFPTLIGVACAILLWISLMPFFVNRTKAFFNRKINILINIFSAIVFFGFGISILIRILLTLQI